MDVSVQLLRAAREQAEADRVAARAAHEPRLLVTRARMLDEPLEAARVEGGGAQQPASEAAAPIEAELRESERRRHEEGAAAGRVRSGVRSTLWAALRPQLGWPIQTSSGPHGGHAEAK